MNEYEKIEALARLLFCQWANDTLHHLGNIVKIVLDPAAHPWKQACEAYDLARTEYENLARIDRETFRRRARRILTEFGEVDQKCLERREKHYDRIERLEERLAQLELAVLKREERVHDEDGSIPSRIQR